MHQTQIFVFLIGYLLTTTQIYSGTTNFLFFGDFGTGDKHQYQVANGIEKFCSRQKCQFAITLGDNIYPGGTLWYQDPQFMLKFENPYHKLQFPFYMVLGNHDYRDGRATSQIFHSYHSHKWKMPAHYYAFKKNNVEFLALDTTAIVSGHYDAQLQWLKNKLSQPWNGWRIVFGHHPIFTYGRRQHNQTLRQLLLPLLREAKVTFYLAGHEHDQQVIQHKSITHIIAGSAGKLRSTGKGPLTLYSRSTRGFGAFQISGNTATMTLLDEHGRPHYQKTLTRPYQVQNVSLHYREKLRIRAIRDEATTSSTEAPLDKSA